VQRLLLRKEELMNLLGVLSLLLLSSCLPSAGKSKLNFATQSLAATRNAESTRRGPVNADPSTGTGTGTGTGTSTGTAAFEEIKKNILVPYNCLDCHRYMKEEAGFLTKVKPGDPDKSIVYLAVLNGDMPEVIPHKPIKAPQLVQSDLDLLRKYILSLKRPMGVSFEMVKSKILEPYQCLLCHRRMTDEVEFLQNVVRGKAEESAVFQVAKDGSMPPKKSPRRPELKGEPVSTEDLELLRKYIDALK
jgi:hypothetical protein